MGMESKDKDQPMYKEEPRVSMDSFQFTTSQDWFSHNIETWSSLLHLVESRRPRVLEIGSWEGRSAVYLLDHLCQEGGEIVCVDHFDLFKTEAGRERFSRVEHNLALTGKKWSIISQFSVPALMELLAEETTSTNPGFDWIYVDGSHEADDTMLDGELAWRLARKHAIVIFDDYHWDKESKDSIHHPKRGIDAFMLLHQGEYERLSQPMDYQVVLRKLVDMRIGFLVGGGNSSVAVDKARVNVVLTVDSAYAIGAAVTIRSIVETTPNRVTIYVVDCGLSPNDKSKLEAIIDKRIGEDITMVFLSLPENSLASKMGPAWAKLDMIGLLPVERVLYLDADTLVRRTLKDLWDIDLNGRSIGAATDVGHPMGHAGVDRSPYFNAGVLLLDLAKLRDEAQALQALGETMKGATFRDQDALNVHLNGNWTDFGLEWNGQGLGTYARYPSEDRDALANALEKMKDPGIVHFTGPVHPTVVEVLNPYVQPTTAKPWGYLGAPGHPYEAAWWDMLTKTPWSAFKTSAERVAEYSEEMKKAFADAERSFRKSVVERADRLSSE